MKRLILALLLLLPLAASAQWNGCPAGFCSPKVAGVTFSLDFAGHAEDNTGGTSITFTAVPIGVADANRVVGVGVWWRENSDTDTITSMTVGGISASQASGARSTRADGGLCLSDIWYAAVPTGTTANVVVNFSAAALRGGVSTYRIITSTPTPSATSFGISLTSGVSTGSITVPSGGAGFAMYGNRNQSSATTWTNAVLDYDADVVPAAGFARVSSGKFTATNSIIASGSDGFAGAAISGATWGP